MSVCVMCFSLLAPRSACLTGPGALAPAPGAAASQGSEAAVTRVLVLCSDPALL